MKNNINVKIYGSRVQMGKAAAEGFAVEVDRLLQEKEAINVIFAAAPSQNEFLESLSEHPVQWGRINAFHMDEYIGLPADAPQAFGNFLKERIFDRYPFRTVHYLNGNAADINVECERYTLLLKEFPVDIVCMGIGENGHLAFNDPPVADFNDPAVVKMVMLDQDCRVQQVNDGCFTHLDHVPTAALTLTIPALMKAGFISCVVPGKLKAKAVSNTFQQQLSTKYPSTVLNSHENVVLYLDADSSSGLAS